VIGAAGTRHFEPDGVAFSRSSLYCPILPTGDGERLAVAGCGSAKEHRSRDRFSDSPFPLKPCSGTLDPQMSPMLGCRRNRDKMQVTAFR
jgi:hypothetical protein